MKTYTPTVTFVLDVVTFVDVAGGKLFHPIPMGFVFEPFALVPILFFINVQTLAIALPLGIDVSFVHSVAFVRVFGKTSHRGNAWGLLQDARGASGAHYSRDSTVLEIQLLVQLLVRCFLKRRGLLDGATGAQMAVFVNVETTKRRWTGVKRLELNVMGFAHVTLTGG